MMNQPNFRSVASELKDRLNNLGFPDPVADLYGAALDAAIGNSAGVARNLLDAYEPLAAKTKIEGLTNAMCGAAFISSPQNYFPLNVRMVCGYISTNPASFPTPAQMKQILNTLMNRLNPPNFLPVINQMNPSTPLSPNQSIPETLAKTFEQVIASLEGKIEKKLEAEAQAPVKKKKKKGGLGKIKKSFSKKFKSVAKFAKMTFKSLTQPLQKSLSGFLKSLQTGNVFEFGRALTGGLIGGPAGGFLLQNLMNLGGKKNPLQQALKQFHSTFDLVGNIHKQQADLQQRSLSGKFLR